ncbi:MAG: DHH family phosphoesterase [Methanomassiliicoccaceae archaeon]|nr:DHH family phosphoesterase [Methanomassiliicoccaceae archaeon]
MPTDEDKRYVSLERDAASAASAIVSSKDVLVIAHIDADGISAAAIASRTLERLDIPHEVVFVKKLDDISIDMINKSRTSLVWLVDLGSGYLSSITKQNVIVADHHVPDPTWMTGQTSLYEFSGMIHVNPHTHGIDGSESISGAGVTYLISKMVDEKNKDLAYLAIIGANGDIQDKSDSRLIGYNRKILSDAVENGDIVADDDIRLFGRETRPLVQFLQYCNDPVLPLLTSNNQECIRFLSELRIELKRNGSWRAWNDLNDDEKDNIKISLIELLESSGVSGKDLMGEVYTLPKFRKGSELRDAKEFATLLNACGRYDDAPVGMRICLGDAEALNEASKNRSEHKKQLSIAMNFVKQSNIIREKRYIQYFHARSEIRDTIVGIVVSIRVSLIVILTAVVAHHVQLPLKPIQFLFCDAKAYFSHQ